MQYDPTDWNTQIAPYETYAWLREHAPVYHNEAMDFWALSRFEDVWDAHLDWETFTSTWGCSPTWSTHSWPTSAPQQATPSTSTAATPKPAS